MKKTFLIAGIISLFLAFPLVGKAQYTEFRPGECPKELRGNATVRM